VPRAIRGRPHPREQSCNPPAFAPRGSGLPRLGAAAPAAGKIVACSEFYRAGRAWRQSFLVCGAVCEGCRYAKSITVQYSPPHAQNAGREGLGEPPATTLTICAARVRRKAKPDNLVLAFNGKRVKGVSGRELHLEPHSVRWAGIVAEVIPLADYCNNPRFEGKKPGRSRGYPDNIYRPANGGFDQVLNPTHDKSFTENDIWGAKSLVFRCQRAHSPRAFLVEDERRPSDASLLGDQRVDLARTQAMAR
jgi:hypothetical protein